MMVYTYSEARRKLASLLDQAISEGEVRIKRRDGQSFVIRPEEKETSPLDVAGIDLGVTTDEILEFVQEGRTRYDLPSSSDKAEASC
jgi:hypothetical protein